jgi:hypothetical protein
MALKTPKGPDRESIVRHGLGERPDDLAISAAPTVQTNRRTPSAMSEIDQAM